MRLSAIAYYSDFLLSGLLILALFAGNLPVVLHQNGTAEILTWIVSALAGVVVWSFAEYVIHRFIYHHIPVIQDMHDAHHAEPEALIGGPPIIGILLIFSVGFLPIVAFSLPAASGATAGLLTGYLAYMSVHHADHYWKPKPGTMLYKLRMHHALHHFRSDEGNFGIITPFWDHVFGTVLKPTSDRASRHPA